MNRLNGSRDARFVQSLCISRVSQFWMFIAVSAARGVMFLKHFDGVLDS